MQQLRTTDASRDHLDLSKQEDAKKRPVLYQEPPKAEDIDNENTHYQRAHLKNVKFSFFGQESAGNSHLCFMRSIVDKAYLRPGTSEGFQNTRNQKILTLTDVEEANQLPKYDWPEKLVYQTPGSHRILTKTPTMADDNNNLPGQVKPSV